MLKEEVRQSLIDAGYTVEDATATKNGITFEGIRINAGKVSPIIYDTYMEKINDVDELLKVVETAINTAPPVTLGSWEEDKNRVKLCIRKYIVDDVITAPFADDLQIYARLMVEETATSTASIVINKPLLDHYGISADELLQTAKENTAADANYMSMGDIIGAPTPGMFVLRTKNEIYGAGAITNTEMLEDLTDRENVPYLVLIPSSVHEFIALAVEDLSNLADIAPLIAMVNDTTVDPVEQLGTHPYIYTAATRAITAA